MTLVIALSSAHVNASAATLKSDKLDELISVQEYEAAMRQIYAEYEIDWKIVDFSDAKPITKELFLSEIARAKSECEAYKDKISRNQVEFMKSKENNGALSINDNYVIRGLMPVTGNYHRYYDINFNNLAGCRLYARANATYNANTDVFLTLNSSSIIKYSAVNLDSLDDQSYFYLNDSHSALYVAFEGTAYFSYTISAIGVKIEQAVPYFAHIPWSTTDAGQVLYNFD